MDRVLGIDPGLNTTGYAVIEAAPSGPRVIEAGVVRPGSKQKKLDMAVRLQGLYDGLLEVITDHKPKIAAMEQLYSHYAHPRTAIMMGHARGVLMLAAVQRGITVVSHAATMIKKTITGSGRATKDQIQRAMQQELRLATLPEPADVADALAVALCQYYLRGTKLAIETNSQT
jgi:crossover junction endodeoxyribonuclease RuvC